MNKHEARSVGFRSSWQEKVIKYQAIGLLFEPGGFSFQDYNLQRALRSHQNLNNWRQGLTPDILQS
ncbi:hypothetical protein A3195_08930 [Candidatus Thiodiazotropha endoloripes]|uniref:Uncharacterized protein n=1 Tax=Candidatus Thiodiazotropha endoloripes TaxID=1818881 RepID=A0A1E2UM55_9GAMM|nr:hypothetical protein A3193_14970 [Candidatus Thiodiazotropha endoloripes]ODB91509.1 hypothetical protein A3195_08930 [Candidatus Thiodiazotropha endoloripes]ODB93650.1 hypothetical protein A3194_02905 [Candidatus Thiodiazotropha endoloripes]ODB95810.1 hypothetical protein A3196_03005 [Candidatus Thiodiazotropha endoloripes]